MYQCTCGYWDYVNVVTDKLVIKKCVSVVTDKQYISVITDKLCQRGYW
jgi:hypothetical protein